MRVRVGERPLPLPPTGWMPSPFFQSPAAITDLIAEPRKGTNPSARRDPARRGGAAHRLLHGEAHAAPARTVATGATPSNDPDISFASRRRFEQGVKLAG